MSLETLSSRAPSLPMPMIHSGTGWPSGPQGAPWRWSNSCRAWRQALSSASSARAVMARVIRSSGARSWPSSAMSRCSTSWRSTRSAPPGWRPAPARAGAAAAVRWRSGAAGAGTGAIARPLARRLLRQVQRAAMAWGLRPDAARARTLAARAAPIIRAPAPGLRVIISATFPPAMIDPTTPPPSRLLKTVAGLARWSLRLLLAFWLLLAIIWGVLHGAIVPRIGDFRPQLEAYAARTLGVAVRIGAVAAATEGVVLSIGLSDVNLLDAARRPGLRLAPGVLALSARPLLEAGGEQLFIDRPEVEIRRTRDGRIQGAGLEFAHEGSGRSAAADWLFAQREVFIQGGTVRWSDEQRQAPVLALSQVDLVLRNGNWQHLMRLDATPPPAWGDRFTLVGRLRASLLHARDSNWRYWNGQLFADFARVDVSQLRHHADLGANVEVARGRGALRAWADVRDGQIVGGT